MPGNKSLEGKDMCGSLLRHGRFSLDALMRLFLSSNLPERPCFKDLATNGCMFSSFKRFNIKTG